MPSPKATQLGFSHIPVGVSGPDVVRSIRGGIANALTRHDDLYPRSDGSTGLDVANQDTIYAKEVIRIPNQAAIVPPSTTAISHELIHGTRKGEEYVKKLYPLIATLFMTIAVMAGAVEKSWSFTHQSEI
jgi:hypothetical protein